MRLKRLFYLTDAVLVFILITQAANIYIGNAVVGTIFSENSDGGIFSATSGDAVCDRSDSMSEEAAAAVGNFDEITVLITNPDDGGYFHSTLSFSSDADVLLTEDDSQTLLAAGQTFCLEAESFTEGEVISMEPLTTGSEKESVFSNEDDSDAACSFKTADSSDDAIHLITVSFYDTSGSASTRSYEGTVTIEVTQEGLLLRNTLPLERYLCYVVPAEMPASYPQEALKAQAICARTFALFQAMAGNYSEYGADLTDSTSCQVYNTQGRDERSDAAILATAGAYLLYEGKPAECYFFSTSCGVTADASIWCESVPYLNAVRLVNSGNVKAAISQAAKNAECSVVSALFNGETELLKEEEEFRNFIDSETEGAESDEPWYRWSVTFTLDALSNRAEEVGTIENLEITSRGSGGVAQTLILYGTKGQKQIESQYAIRSFFRLEGETVIRQDGSEVSENMLLPSAFFYIMTEEDGTVILHGGGYGHGCGMSQNAAKAYAQSGLNASETLSLFYAGAQIAAIVDGS